MTLQHELDMLSRDYGLKPADVQLLDLVPLIEAIWADGRNQESELKILYRFTIEHLAALDRMAGAQAVSVAEANDFLDRFAHRRPPPELLERLRRIALARHAGAPSGHGGEGRWHTLIDYCLDIAAACIPAYPYQMHERVIAEEKAFLKDLVEALRRIEG